MEQSPGKIFLSEQRGCIESPLFQRNCTFNFGTFFSPHKTALGPLYLFNEETLAGAAELEMEIGTSSYAIIIPVTGDLEYTDVEAGKLNIGVGEVLIRKCTEEHLFSISNPYEKDAISLIQICLSAPGALSPAFELFNLDPGISVNHLVEVSAPTATPLPFRLSVGQFDGRAETLYQKRQKDSRLFCYVLAGAFEIEGRLLHAQDGLGLCDVEHVELEALSNNALILTIEY